MKTLQLLMLALHWRADISDAPHELLSMVIDIICCIKEGAAITYITATWRYYAITVAIKTDIEHILPND